MCRQAQGAEGWQGWGREPERRSKHGSLGGGCDCPLHAAWTTLSLNCPLHTDNTTPLVSCPACGQSCGPEARFCPHCGKLVGLGDDTFDPVVGQVIAKRYRIEERLGADGMGRLYRASGLAGGGAVTIRLLHEHLATNTAFAARFEQAAAAAAAAVGPGVVRLLEAGQVAVNGRLCWYLVNEAFEGRNLCAIVQVRGLLPVPQAVGILLRAIDALVEIHGSGTFHGDLKPENVIVGAGPDGEVCAKLADCVIAALAAKHTPRVGIGGSALGTPVYRAPEARGGPSVAGDIYSVGVMLYEQLTGSRPFDTCSCIAYECLQRDEDPLPPRRKAPSRGIGPALDAVVMTAMARDPSTRFASASDLARALRNALAEDAASGMPGPRGEQESARSGAFGFTPRRSLVGRSDLVDAVMAKAVWPASSPVGASTCGAAVILLGGAGMGKSAIVHEVIERLAGGPVAVLRIDGQCSAARPLEPFVALARDLLGLHRGADSQAVATVSAVLHSSFGFDAEDVVRLVDRTTARPSSLAAPLDIIEREEVASLRCFLGRVLASRPTLLVIEDADAMDAASIDLARDLMHAAKSMPLCVLLTARSDPWPEWSAPHALRLFVPGLDPETSRALLRTRLVGRGVSADSVEIAVQWAKGSPLILDLCARAMIRRELLIGSDGRWVAPSTSQELFGGMRELVAMALRAARAPARRWLSCAALVGHRTPIALVETWEPPGGAREEMIQSCQATGMVRIEGGMIVYQNEGVRDTVQALVPESERKRIHEFLAAWFSETTPPRAPRDEIAAHLEAAGDSLQAAKLLEQEAQDLVDRGEPRMACLLFNRAERLLAAAGSTDEAMRIGLMHVEALLASGDGRAAADMIGQLERLGPLAADGLRARAAASVALAQGDNELALRALRQASDQAVDSLDPMAWFQVESELAALLHHMGRHEEAHTHAALALELARSIADGAGASVTLQDSERVSKAAAFLSRVLLARALTADARAVLQLALEQAALVGDETSATRLLGNLAHACAVEGDLPKAIEFGQRALEFARRSGDRLAASRIALNVGSYFARLGRGGDAARSFALAKASARAVGWEKGVRLAREATASLTPMRVR